RYFAAGTRVYSGIVWWRVWIPRVRRFVEPRIGANVRTGHSCLPANRAVAQSKTRVARRMRLGDGRLGMGVPRCVRWSLALDRALLVCRLVQSVPLFPVLRLWPIVLRLRFGSSANHSWRLAQSRFLAS